MRIGEQKVNTKGNTKEKVKSKYKVNIQKAMENAVAIREISNEIDSLVAEQKSIARCNVDLLGELLSRKVSEKRKARIDRKYHQNENRIREIGNILFELHQRRRALREQI